MIMNLLKNEWVRCRFFSDCETEANNHELMMVRMRYPYDVKYDDFQYVFGFGFIYKGHLKDLECYMRDPLTKK